MTPNVEDLIAHCVFDCTATPAQPTVRRQYRCTITRVGAGEYLLTLTDGLAEQDLDLSASITADDGGTWFDIKCTRLTDTTWRVVTWIQSQNINQGLPAYGSIFGTLPEANVNAGAAVVFESAGPMFGGVQAPTTSQLLLPLIGNYEINWNLAFTTPSELGLFADPATGVFALVAGSVAITSPDAGGAPARNTNSIMFTTTANNTLIELRNVGTAAEVHTPADAVLDDNPSFSLSAKLLSRSESQAINPITQGDAVDAIARITMRKVAPG